MRFSELAEYFKSLEKTSSRIAITEILSRLFKKTESDEIDKVAYLSLGILAPSYEGVILNLAEKMMVRVLAKAYGVEEEIVKKRYKEAGDLGDVAQTLAKGKVVKGGNLTVAQVYERLIEIASDNGEGSQERKINKTAELLKNLDALSARFVSRIPVGRLRLGFSEKTIIDALGLAFGLKTAEIEAAYNVRPDIGYMSKLAKTNKLGEVSPKVGVPVVPMLAQRLNSAVEMIKKMGEVSVEPKFDGLRIFIHFRRGNNLITESKKTGEGSGDKADTDMPPTFMGESVRNNGGDLVKIFTRNMNSIDVAVFPELVDVGKYIKANEVILDTEAIGIDPTREMFLDFQKTMQRRRKHEVAKTAGEIPLQFQVFDVLYVDGKNLISEDYINRRGILKNLIVNGNLLRVDENTVTTDPNVIKKMHEKYLKMGLEGVVVKKTSGKYVSGRTGWNWVKMKEAEGKQGKLSDTVDCVVMGATLGKGKRSGFGIGQFLAGVKDGNMFRTITKVGTGLTDDQFKELKTRLETLRVKAKPKEYLVNKSMEPDFWVIPKVVVELAADEITVSPNHTTGYALRFPRLVRFREDKDPADVTTVDEIKEILGVVNK